MVEHTNGCDTGAEQAMAALSDKDVNELRGLAERLTKGHESLAEMLKDLELEREELEKEKGQLNETISLFMKDLQKLNIGAHNTVEPMLEEGPLDFVGRFWETVKPRDSAYVTGEHIGEIRKPGEKTGPTNPLAALKEAAMAHAPQELPNQAAQVQEKVQERVHEVQEMGKQAAKKLSNAFEEARSSPFWQKAQGYWEEKRSEIAKKVHEVQEKVHEVQASAAASTQRPAAAPGKTRKKGEPRIVAADKSEAAPSDSTTPPEASEASQETAESSTKEATPEKPKSPEKVPAPEPNVESAPPKEAEAASAASTASAAPSEKTSRQETILIEAQVKIGDGSVQTLCVRASDRCKDAAERFISENSLKASFTKPLTDFLKKVEKDAETFPVHTEIDLSDLGPPALCMPS